MQNGTALDPMMVPRTRGTIQSSWGSNSTKYATGKVARPEHLRPIGRKTWERQLTRAIEYGQ